MTLTPPFLAIARAHYDIWLSDNPADEKDAMSALETIENAIAEALRESDKNRSEGIEAIKHERDRAQEKVREMFHLLLEARDALPAIQLHAAKLHNVRLDLADRIEACLAPWEIKEDNAAMLEEDKKSAESERMLGIQSLLDRPTQ